MIMTFIVTIACAVALFLERFMYVKYKTLFPLGTAIIFLSLLVIFPFLSSTDQDLLREHWLTIATIFGAALLASRFKPGS